MTLNYASPALNHEQAGLLGCSGCAQVRCVRTVLGCMRQIVDDQRTPDTELPA